MKHHVYAYNTWQINDVHNKDSQSTALYVYILASCAYALKL